MLKINNLSPLKKSKFKKKRICRGIGSGRGKTGGRGNKGQKSRSGGKINKGFQGGQTPIYKKLPKFGFKSNNKKIKILKLSKLNLIDNLEINLNILKENKFISKNDKFIKIVFDNDINRKIIIKNIFTTSKVRKSIENFGGIIEI